MTTKKQIAEAHEEDGEVEPRRLPKPVEPKNAGSTERQLKAPVYPDDYDTSEQPNEPQVPKAPKKD